jgi:hypothetical protein
MTFLLRWVREIKMSKYQVLEAEFSTLRSWPGPRRVHASKNNAVHSQQHILTQL